MIIFFIFISIFIYYLFSLLFLTVTSLSSVEQENLARLQRAFARKWEFIYMQAEAQVK